VNNIKIKLLVELFGDFDTHFCKHLKPISIYNNIIDRVLERTETNRPRRKSKLKWK
jgi:hypothetical protein